MIRHGLIVIRPARTLWRGAAALVPDMLCSAAHNQNKGRQGRSRWVIRTKCRSAGSHGSSPTDDLASPRNDADLKSP
jgi:hypothetical protein